ncbi:hypothetical protein ACROYT_G030197 [Oculina patagonica]
MVARQRLRIAVQLLLCQVFCEISAQKCEGEYSIFGMMLKKHIFKTIKTSNSPECIRACGVDVRCQSFNYVISQYMCELNNRTKEARPEDFVPDSNRYYYGRVRKRVPLGSIPELPAESCKEIKASEGGQAVSGKYWFDSVIPGKVVLAQCNMETEDIADIDECDIGIHDCLKDLARCTNTLGSYTCACIHGYVGDGKTSCIHLPEECFTYTSLTDGKRKVTAPADVKSCDSTLGTGWYRFQGDAGTKMPTTCPPTHRCGTDAPGWLNGAHPTMAEGLVTRQVCFHWESNCCYSSDSWSESIQVRNCSSYFIYFLSPTNVCQLRYCSAD